MKTLVVFYSLEGNTRLIAQQVAKELEADLLELLPKKEFPKGSFKKFIWGGKSVVFKDKPELINEKKNLADYDTIVFGTPIWAGTYAAPLHTFLSDESITNKNIALFACHAGGGAAKCFANFKEMLPGNQFVAEVDFKDPKSNNSEEVKKVAEVFINTLKKIS